MNPILKPHFIESQHNHCPCIVRIDSQRFTKTMETEFKHILKVQLRLDSTDWSDWEYDLSHFIKDNEDDICLGYCICGKDITHCRYIKYKPQNIYFQVGMDCIKKNLTELHEVIAEEIKDERAMIRKKNKFRQCVSCREFLIKIDSPSYYIKCKECYTLDKPVYHEENIFRQCCDCKEFNISKTLPLYHTKCKECYYLSRPEEEFRKCIDCKKNTIKANSEKWITRCGTCYQKIKNQQ